VGVSNYGTKLLQRAKAYFDTRGVPLASNQINFSLLYRKQGSQETVDWCRENGIAVLGYFPLANGLLAGKYTEANLPSGLKGMAMRKYVIGGVVERGVTYPKGGVAPLITEMRRISDARAKSIAQVALNYAMSKGVIPIPGCRNSKMAAENAKALDWRLEPSEVQALEAASDALGFEFSGGGFGLDQE
jgi:pyridoxine 4-dehydrogenase